MGKSTINGPFSIAMYVYQRVLNSSGMILHGLKPPMPTYPGVQAVLGRNDAQFHITGWHVAGAVDQIYDALEEHPPEKPMGISHEIWERPETKTPGNQSRGI